MKKSQIFVLVFFAIFGYGQIPAGYYSGATGSGYTLKTQLHNTIKDHTDRGYSGLWSTYETSDRDHQNENDNTIFDLYSENQNGVDPYTFVFNTGKCGGYAQEGDCYNREHMIPQSTFNSAAPMVSDAHFIPPTDGKVNGIRSNYPHGNVASASITTLNGCKLGSSAVVGYTGIVFEPAAAFKGDIARMYFYFATRYENTVASYNYDMFNNTSTQVFTPEFLKVLLDWHKNDPVSAREIERNNAIYERQGNRNPFIDNPNYVTAIWGSTSNNATADTVAPSIPTNLTSNAKTTNSVSLTWTAATDNIAVTGYEVYNGTSLVATTTATSCNVTGLTDATSYNFTVKAKDAAGNKSANSNALTVTTDVLVIADTTAPTTPTNLASNGKTTTSVSLTWTAATDNIAVTGYEVYNGTNLVGTTTATSCNVTGLTDATSYNFTVKAKDAAGNKSANSNALTVTTDVLVIADTTAPTTPTNLASNGKTTTSVSLTWNAATDNIAVTGYEVYNGTNLVATTTATNYNVAGLTDATSYNFTVKAKDAAGNKSASSTSITVTTNVLVIADTTAPTTPANLTSNGKTTTSVSLTWNAATDNVAVTGYEVYNGTNLVATTTVTNYNVTGLVNATSYNFTVKAKDTAGNKSASSTSITVTTNAIIVAKSDLYLSEYIEGSGNNKALEIKNETNNSISLSSYTIKKQSNGAGIWSAGLVLSGTLPVNGKFVIINNTTTTTCYSTTKANLSTAASEMTFNGNDAIGLFKNGTLIDVIGVYNGGIDDFAKDVTLRRKTNAIAPKSTYSASDWDIFALDNCTGLGNKTSVVKEEKTEIKATDISVYPNPNNGSFSIILDGISKNNFTIEIYSTLGQKVLQKENIKTENFEVQNLEKGIYFIKISNQYQTITKKVIVN